MTELDNLKIKTSNIEETLLNKNETFNFSAILGDIEIAKEQASSVKQELEALKSTNLILDTKLQTVAIKANEADNKAQQAYSAAISSLGNQR
jgi:hypothetical protein